MKHHIHALDVQETSGFQIPTFSEVVRNATFVNGPPLIPNPPPTLNLSGGRQLLFPFMNFTCNGRIIRLTFLGWLSGSSEQFDVTRLMSWPYFSLWRPHQHQFEEIQIGPNDLLTGSLSLSRINVTHQMVEVTLTTNVMFSADDILGVTLWQNRLPTGNGIYSSIELLKSRGYGETPVYDHNCQSTHAQCNLYSLQEKPYVAIEIGEM